MGQQGGGNYRQVGSPGDVRNINPWTENVFNRFEQMLPGAQAGMNDIAQRLMGLEYDPEAAQRMFMSQVPGLRELVRDSTRPYEGAAQSWAQMAADQARRDVANQYSGGGMYSGAFGSAVGQGMAQPYMQAAMGEAQMQGEMTQDMFQNTLMQLANQYSTGKQLEAAGLQNAGNLYGQQFGAASDVMGRLAAPEWWQPTYVYEPEEQPMWQQMMGGALTGGLTGLATGGPVGGVIGALGGGASGALGTGNPASMGYAGGMIGGRMGAGAQVPGTANYSTNVPASMRSWGGETYSPSTQAFSPDWGGESYSPRGPVPNFSTNVGPYNPQGYFSPQDNMLRYGGYGSMVPSWDPYRY